MSAPAGTSPRPVASWREETRQDRLVRAQIDRDREASRAQVRIAERQAAALTRRDQARTRAVDRQQARKARTARRAARAAWVRGHVVDLLFVPVIAVPALLAWTAMAAFGAQVYGPLGLALPAFSEGAMWAFAAATTLTRHRHPDRPLWHLRTGTVTFAGVGAALNFAHGLTEPPVPGAPHGLGVAVVMAVISVAGVTAHQFVTAGPRRSRTDRAHARIARAAARRQMAARRAAVRHAVADLDEHGNARLIFTPGVATLTRRHGRTRLGPGPHGTRALPVPAGPVRPWPRPAPVLPAPGPVPGRAPAPASAPAPGRTRARRGAPARTRGRTRAVTGESAEVHFAADLAEGQVPSVRRIKTELHIGQDRAQRIHDHLAAVMTTTRHAS